MNFFDENIYNWGSRQQLRNKSFICGYCSNKVASNRGYQIGNRRDGGGEQVGGVYICPNCQGPVFFNLHDKQFPAPPCGQPVNFVPDELTELYDEARRCTSAGCYTAAVLLCRKMLMNIAVAQGEKPGLPFINYVNYLSSQGYIPPNGKHWVNHIRLKGNEATHEITVMNQTDASELLNFTEMLLKFIYEFPAMVPPPTIP